MFLLVLAMALVHHPLKMRVPIEAGIDAAVAALVDVASPSENEGPY